MQNRNVQQPISITGALRHCFLWATSESKDVLVLNPNASNQLDDQADQVAIFCVHGTADRSNAFSLVAERLKDNLPPHISMMCLLAFDERAQGKEIEVFSRQLLNKINATGHRNVILMGHSRGGLVCSYFAEYLAQDAGISVKGVFALASPFGGSDKAIAPLTWMSASVAQMQPQSEFLMALNRKVAASTIPYFYFAAENDELVPLSSSFVLGGENNLIVLRRHGHLSMMSSWKMVEHIRKRITGEDCALSLQTLLQEANDYVADFKEAQHVFSSASKIYLLQQFVRLISDLIQNPEIGYYADARTIGDMVQSYLSDRFITDDGTSVMETINTPLNTFFQMSNTSTANFFLGLSTRYRNIPLPGRVQERLELSLDLSSERQNLSQSV